MDCHKEGMVQAIVAINTGPRRTIADKGYRVLAPRSPYTAFVGSGLLAGAVLMHCPELCELMSNSVTAEAYTEGALKDVDTYSSGLHYGLHLLIT